MKLTKRHLRKMILKEMSSMGIGMEMGGESDLSSLIFHLTSFRDFLARDGRYITRNNPQLLSRLSSMIGGLQSGDLSPGLINALKSMFLGDGFQYRSPKLDGMLAPIRSILNRM